jgi:hypothetical protein
MMPLSKSVINRSGFNFKLNFKEASFNGMMGKERKEKCRKRKISKIKISKAINMSDGVDVRVG